ncbi:MAG TPA: glycoside hydrolase family 28 protein [Verrucomicrobiae bacterium]|nr:glycoside hydrolase family 28 protein [Verrucomicrobiae bacterium]
MKARFRRQLPALVLAAAATTAACAAAGATWDPREFGAKVDGRTPDTAAIQAAVDACAEAGGGTVMLRGGVFLSGTICLRSHVTLHIEGGATLRGSADIRDYPSITPRIEYLYRGRFTKSLIFAEGQEHIGLIGGGVIDGQGKLFPAKKGDDGGRPYLIRFSECRDVRVRDLTLRDSARWLSHYLACENVTIDGVTIHSRIRENRDGMDIDSCDRVRISNCDIYSGDDAIVLKSTAARPCRRVAVSNCTLSSSASALKLGTESQGGFEDITFGNCVVYDTRDGVSIEEVDGGACERINVSNIVMRNVAVPIFVRLGNRANPLPGREKPAMGKMRDIMISNIQADGAAVTGCSVTGLPDHPVGNVTLDNIRIRFVGGGTAGDATRTVPEKETSYPKGDMFGTLPAYGFFCRHVKGLRLHNVDLSLDGADARPAIIVEDVADFDESGLRAEGGPKAKTLERR